MSCPHCRTLLQNVLEQIEVATSPSMSATVATVNCARRQAPWDDEKLRNTRKARK